MTESGDSNFIPADGDSGWFDFALRLDLTIYWFINLIHALKGRAKTQPLLCDSKTIKPWRHDEAGGQSIARAQ